MKKLPGRFSLSKGFTLIELLVVIAILGILAVLVLTIINPGNRIASGKNSRVRSDLASIGRSATLFYTDSGSGAGCTPAGSYPGAFGQTNTGCTPANTFMAAVNDPNNVAYVVTGLGVSAGCTSAGGTNPCTSISVRGPAFTDGVIDASTLLYWCWRSATGTVTQVAACAP